MTSFNTLYERNPRMGCEQYRKTNNKVVQDFTECMEKV